jgi:hypothetical protein
MRGMDLLDKRIGLILVDISIVHSRDLLMRYYFASIPHELMTRPHRRVHTRALYSGSSCLQAPDCKR